MFIIIYLVKALSRWWIKKDDKPIIFREKTCSISINRPVFEEFEHYRSIYSGFIGQKIRDLGNVFKLILGISYRFIVANLLFLNCIFFRYSKNRHHTVNTLKKGSLHHFFLRFSSKQLVIYFQSVCSSYWSETVANQSVKMSRVWTRPNYNSFYIYNSIHSVQRCSISCSPCLFPLKKYDCSNLTK